MSVSIGHDQVPISNANDWEVDALITPILQGLSMLESFA